MGERDLRVWWCFDDNDVERRQLQCDVGSELRLDEDNDIKRRRDKEDKVRMYNKKKSEGKKEDVEEWEQEVMK